MSQLRKAAIGGILLAVIVGAYALGAAPASEVVARDSGTIERSTPEPTVVATPEPTPQPTPVPTAVPLPEFALSSDELDVYIDWLTRSSDVLGVAIAQGELFWNSDAGSAAELDAARQITLAWAGAKTDSVVSAPCWAVGLALWRAYASEEWTRWNTATNAMADGYFFDYDSLSEITPESEAFDVWLDETEGDKDPCFS